MRLRQSITQPADEDDDDDDGNGNDDDADDDDDGGQLLNAVTVGARPPHIVVQVNYSSSPDVTAVVRGRPAGC